MILSCCHKFNIIIKILRKYVKFTLNDTILKKKIFNIIENIWICIATFIGILMCMLQFIIIGASYMQISSYLLYDDDSLNKISFEEANTNAPLQIILCRNNITYYKENSNFCYEANNNISLNILLCEILIIYLIYVYKYIKSSQNANKTLIPKLLITFFHYTVTVMLCVYFTYKFIIMFALLCVFILDISSIYFICKNYKNQLVEKYNEMEQYEIQIIIKQDE